MVFNATFNNISVISWRSDSLVEETGVPEENHRLVANHWKALSHNVVHLALVSCRTPLKNKEIFILIAVLEQPEANINKSEWVIVD